MESQITIRGARLHNLKNVTVAIPKNQLVVLTGAAGGRLVAQGAPEQVAQVPGSYTGGYLKEILNVSFQ
jgi:excinuclease UvrABC ATPase subunit